MSSKAMSSKHYLRILRLWPKDKLRALTFHTAMRRRLASKFPSPSSPNTQPPPPAQPLPTEDLAQINALYSLLENRYAAQYPVSPTLMRPAFNPGYYEALAAEMEAAPGRSWLANKWLRLSRLVRFS